MTAIITYSPTLQRQLAVIKGQAWNIVQSLRHAVSHESCAVERYTHGLSHRTKVNTPVY